MSKSLDLKTIDEITKHSYIIPAYQRGYRWRPENVIALLNDLNEFFNSNTDGTYLLQPIIIKSNKETCLEKIEKFKNIIEQNQENKDAQDLLNELTKNCIPKEETNSYELVDGQQRLTTIYLILNYLDIKDKDFHITYETRENSQEFLNNPEEPRKNENPDFYALYCAWQAIKKWFGDNNVDQENKEIEKIKSKIQNISKDKFAEKLLNEVQVIWYEPEEADMQKIFRRINAGKIPLTPSELIRSLFLKLIKDKSQHKESEQNKFVAEWDEINKILKDNEFWYFIFGHDNPLGRMDLFFFHFLNTEKNKNISEQDFRYNPMSVFNAVYDELKDKELTAIFKYWQEFKNFFYRIYDWYLDKETYHLVGFILFQKIKKLSDIISLNTENKSEFKEGLKKIIREKLKNLLQSELTKEAEEKGQGENEIKNKLEKESWEELFKEVDYEFNRNSARFILYLHNLIKYHNDPNDIRFPFKKFKDVIRHSGWSIEHIYARHQEDISNIENIDDYFNNKLKYLYKVFSTQNENKNENLVVKIDDKHEITLNKEEQWTWNNILNDDIINKVKGNDNNSETIKNELKAQIIQDIENQLEEYLQIDFLQNLALLPKGLNSKLSNKFFTEKREIIIKEYAKPENEGVFVPLATFMVFNKLYNVDIENIDFTVWYKQDGDNYFNDIGKSIKQFLSLTSKTDGNGQQ